MFGKAIFHSWLYKIEYAAAISAIKAANWLNKHSQLNKGLAKRSAQKGIAAIEKR